MEFVQQFKAARRVSTPLVAIRTFDASATIETIRETLGDNISDNALIRWDVVHGMQALTERASGELASMLGGNPPEASCECGNALRFAESASKNVTVFLSNAQLFWTEPAVIQGIWNLRDGYKANGNMLVLLLNPGAILPVELVSDVLILDQPLPTEKHIRETVSAVFSFAGLESPDAATLDKATNALIGLPAFPAEQNTAMCIDKKAGKIDIPALWEHKKKTIGQTAGLSVLESNTSFKELGGLGAIKELLTRLMNGNEPPKAAIFTDEVEKAFAGTGTDMSGVKTELTGSMLTWTEDREIDAILCCGVPGVGKSEIAKSLWATFGIPVIGFDLAGMQSGIVGSSGANLRSAQKTVDAISGGKILWVATCNSVSALPPELRSRFKLGEFFFDVPGADERAAIWSIYRTRYNVPVSDSNPADEGWTGREIKECCRKAYRLNMPLDEAARFVIPVTRSSAERIAQLRAESAGKFFDAYRPGTYHPASMQATDAAQNTRNAATMATTNAGRVLRFEEE